MIVYLIRNTANGKCYVGKTCRPLWHRWSQHKAEAKLNRFYSPLHADMRVYQLHCFETEVLAEADTSRKIAALERKFIRIFNSVERGYNLAEQSFGSTRRQRRRPINIGPDPYTITPEHRARINASLRATMAEKRTITC